MRIVFFIKLTIVIISLFLTSFVLVKIESADELDNIANEIEKEQKNLDDIQKNLKNNQSKLNDLSSEINSLSGQINDNKSRINSIEKELNSIDTDIDSINKLIQIAVEQLERKQYTKLYVLNDLNYKSFENNIIYYSDAKISDLIASEQYALVYTEHLLDGISENQNSLKNFKDSKGEYENLKKQTEELKASLQSKVAFINSQVLGARNEQSSVEDEVNNLKDKEQKSLKKLDQLSKEQQRLIALKTDDNYVFNSIDVPSAGDPAASVGYNPGFKDGFAVFSFGAPHRKGMSQYGAKGRADSGQDYEDILKAYYGDVSIKKYDMPGDIKTDQGTMNFEEKYLMGIAEMPSNWPLDALKAQAIAARTYALVYGGWSTDSKSMKKSICTSENCQVWKSSKYNDKNSEKWRKAVKETKGMVVVSNKTGNVFSTLYAATSGGYNYSYTSLGHTTKGGWDTKCGTIDCFTKDAFENISESPWFYKAWYKTRGGASCSRNHPWLTNSEFADIVGALYLYVDDPDNQKHLSQVDSEKCGNGSISDTWSKDKVKDKSGINSVSDIRVEYSSGGYTSKVFVETNRGTFTFEGGDFKDIFNLRAPGMIHLKSALFNVESN